MEKKNPHNSYSLLVNVRCMAMWTRDNVIATLASLCCKIILEFKKWQFNKTSCQQYLLEKYRPTSGKQSGTLTW